MTPPQDHNGQFGNGQFGVPYPGAGRDAFGSPGGYPGEEPSDPSADLAGGLPGHLDQPQPGGHRGHAAPGPAEAPYRRPAAASNGPAWSDPDGGAIFRTPPAAQGPSEEAPSFGGWENKPWGLPAPVQDVPDEQESLIRPYAMTGGRTKPRYQLAIEALVSTTAHPDRIAELLPEHQRICDLCIEIKSVAEVSALLNMPLGVARILVADLAESGLVAIHQPAASGGDAGGQPDVTLLERVLSGLRKL